MTCKNWPVRSDTAPMRTGVSVRGYAAVISPHSSGKTPLSFSICADANCGVLTLFFWCRQLSSAVGGYIVTETWMALALKLCGYHVVVMSCSNISLLCNLQQQQQQPWSVRKRQKHHIHNVMLYSRCVWTFRAIYFVLKQGLKNMIWAIFSHCKNHKSQMKSVSCHSISIIYLIWCVSLPEEHLCSFKMINMTRVSKAL